MNITTVGVDLAMEACGSGDGISQIDAVIFLILSRVPCLRRGFYNGGKMWGLNLS